VIVSHAHPDHIGLAGWLCKEFDVPLLVSQTSYLTCLNIMLSPDALEARQYRDFYQRHGMSPETASLVGSQGHDYLRMVGALPMTFSRLVAGDVLTIGGREFLVYSGDGHSPEQIMLHCPSQGVLLVADQVIAKITPNISVWAVEPDGDPLGLYLRSLDALSRTIPSDVLVLPGHELPFYGLHPRCRALVSHHEERCSLIERSCAEAPRSVADIVPVLFTRELDAHQLGFAFSEAHAHINYLLRLGRLRQETGADGILRVALARR
jgi:glyoxylase-like metal-dependent hydrolase (beta-lactamase superfamily II)